MIIILKYKNTANPLGFPGDYPAERMDVKDGSKFDPPWVEVTEEEYRGLVSRHSDEASAINRSRRENQIAEAKAEQNEKLAQLDAIKEKAVDSDVLTDRDRLDSIPSILKLLSGLQSQIEELIKR